MVWYSHLFKNFPQFVLNHAVSFSVVNVSDFFFFGTPLLSPWFKTYWQFDLWFLCLFETQLAHLDVLGLHTINASLRDFEHNFDSM